jgi:hypothetical protein
MIFNEIDEIPSKKPSMNRMVIMGIDKLSEPLELVISAIVALIAVNNVKNSRYEIEKLNKNLVIKKIISVEEIKNAIVPFTVFLSFQITNSMFLDVFSPMYDAIGSDMVKSERLMITSSVCCQKPIEIIR